MHRALGISVHTGWGACVVVGGSLRDPAIIANEKLELLGPSERFCYHVAAELERAKAAHWLARVRRVAIANARAGLAPLLAHGVVACAIVAKDRDAGDLDTILQAHPRIHTAEGCFYRDAFRDACDLPVEIVVPSSLDASTVGKLAPSPWGKDQKLAALAAWRVLSTSSRSP